MYRKRHTISCCVFDRVGKHCTTCRVNCRLALVVRSTALGFVVCTSVGVGLSRMRPTSISTNFIGPIFVYMGIISFISDPFRWQESNISMKRHSQAEVSQSSARIELSRYAGHGKLIDRFALLVCVLTCVFARVDSSSWCWSSWSYSECC
jgi:hypothetical protein